MIITREMNISARQMFDALSQSVLHDIKQHTGYEVCNDNLTNYEYQKKDSKHGQATIRIEKWQKYKAYHYSCFTSNNNYSVSYDINSTSERTCTLNYCEYNESVGHIQKLNDILVGSLLNRLRRKRFIEMLSRIEQSVL